MGCIKAGVLAIWEEKEGLSTSLGSISFTSLHLTAVSQSTRHLDFRDTHMLLHFMVGRGQWCLTRYLLDEDVSAVQV